MSKFYNVRITTSEENEWWTDMDLNDKVTVLVVHFERSRKNVEHFHAIVKTSMAKEKLNKLLRKVADLGDYKDNRMALSTDETKDLETSISYLKKDGNLKYISQDFLSQYENAKQWVDNTIKKTEKIVEIICKPEKKSFSMYDYLEEISMKMWIERIDKYKSGEGEEYPPEYYTRRQFGMDIVDYLDKHKVEWAPRFRISNWNTFWSYIAQIYWKKYGGGEQLRDMMPNWF